MLQTIQAPEPPVHWARKYSTEIGVGLIFSAFVFLCFAIWAHFNPSTPQDIIKARMSEPPKKHFEFTITPISGSWSSGDLTFVSPGQVVHIQARDKISWDTSIDMSGLGNQPRPTALLGEPNIGPEGINRRPMDLPPSDRPNDFPAQQCNIGSLLMEVGDFGKVNCVGQEYWYVVPENEKGLMVFTINGRQGLYRNKGKFSVRVEIRWLFFS